MEYLIIVKELLVCVAAIITSIVAIKGLYIWRDQLKGTDKYKLSKHILKKTYNLQDAIISVRNPFVPSAESAQRELETKIDTNENERERMVKNEAYALWKRTEPMFNVLSELKIAKFETLALLGKDYIQDIDSMIGKAYELKSAQNIYFRMKIDPSVRDQNLMDKYWKIVYEMPEVEDSYIKDVNDIVSKIEEKFRAFL